MIYEDKRNWPEYNEQLVRRGWFYLSTGFLEHWDKELEDMNQVPIPDPHPKTSINFYQHILFPGEFAATMQQPHIRKLRFKYLELIWFMPNDTSKASCTQKERKTPVTSPEDEHSETPVRPNRPRIRGSCAENSSSAYRYRDLSQSSRL